MARTAHFGFVFGRLVVGTLTSPSGKVVEPATTWANGLFHRGFRLRLPLRGPSPAVLVAWRA